MYQHVGPSLKTCLEDVRNILKEAGSLQCVDLGLRFTRILMDFTRKPARNDHNQ